MKAADKPVYAPFEAPYRMAMGLIGLDPEEWIELDDDLVPDLLEKRRLLAERHAEVFGALPGSEPAQAEVLRLLIAHLAAHAPGHCRRDGDLISLPALDEAWNVSDAGLAPLDLAGRLVQEDLCLMQRHGDGTWRLTAASLCFPTRWRLADKLGRPLDAIHAPVPGFQDRLARPVARFFDHLKAERPVWRLNWSLLDDPALFQPAGHGRATRDESITEGNAGDRLWLRVERQTLRRLPATGAVLFTIRVHRWPLARVAARPELAARLAAAVEALPEAIGRYKSIPVFGEAVVAYLRRAAADERVTPPGR